MDVNESVGQEPPMDDDGMTHLLNASTHVLPYHPLPLLILHSALCQVVVI